MSGTVVEIGLEAEEFALWETIRAYDDINFEIERIVAHDPDCVMPYVWADGPQFDDLDDVLTEDDSVDEFELLADLGDERLYQMDWVARIETLIRILVDEDGTVLSAQGNSEGWSLRILFPDRESLSKTHDYCKENGLSMSIHAIYDIDEGRKGRFGLTDEQQNTLELAFEKGYYEIPREMAMDDLASELDISHQALSERLRRAHRNVVENTVIIGRQESGES